MGATGRVELALDWHSVKEPPAPAPEKRTLLGDLASGMSGDTSHLRSEGGVETSLPTCHHPKPWVCTEIDLQLSQNPPPQSRGPGQVTSFWGCLAI